MKKLIANIEKNGVNDIVKTAIENYTDGFDGVVLWNTVSEKYHGYTWSSNTTSSDENDIEVYRLTGEMLDNRDPEIMMGSLDIIQGNILCQLKYEQQCTDDLSGYDKYSI